MTEDVLGNNPKPAPVILQELNPLELVVEGTRNDLVLLLLGERVEVHGIAGNADGQLRVLLGVSLSVKQRRRPKPAR